MGFELVKSIKDKYGEFESSLGKMGDTVAKALGFNTKSDPLQVEFIADRLTKNPFSVISLFLGDNAGEKQLIQGIFLNELSLSAGNEWNKPFDWGLNNVVSEIANISKYLGELSGVTMGGNTKAATWNSYTHPEMTQAGWAGPKMPTFTFDILLLTLRETDNVAGKIGALYSTVLPTMGKFTSKAKGSNVVDMGGGRKDFNWNKSYLPPLGYMPHGTWAAGTFTVQVGLDPNVWFRGTGMIMESVSVTLSPEVTTSGQPLFAKCSITFRPYIQPTYHDYISWFPKIAQFTSKDFYGADQTAGKKDDKQSNPSKKNTKLQKKKTPGQPKPKNTAGTQPKPKP